MDRVKTFLATGLAPDGRLYAGDLNAIEDAAAALSDFTQTLDLGVLRLGQGDLQLLRYGSGAGSIASEGRFTGDLRIDGLFRSLGGVILGTFTTTQRDAIAAGMAPYGTMILNSTLNEIEMNYGTDVARDWQGVGGVAAGSIDSTKLANNAVITSKINANAVTLAKIDTAVPIIPLGAVVDWPWASGSIPAWSLLPYGQLLTVGGYADLQVLADASGRPHGGVAATNFNLPDYRGRVGAGKDDMGGAAASRVTAAVSGITGTTLGAVGGAEGVTLTTGQLPAHNHSITGSPGLSDPGHTHGILSRTGSGSSGDFRPSYNDPTTTNTMVTNSAGTGISLNAGTLATSNNGSGSAHQNTQPTIIVNKIMRVL